MYIHQPLRYLVHILVIVVVVVFTVIIVTFVVVIIVVFRLHVINHLLGDWCSRQPHLSLLINGWPFNHILPGMGKQAEIHETN